jgi:hypothetical protein
MPDLISVFSDRNANVFFGGLDVLEQAQFNTGGVLGKNGEVDTVAHPGRAKWIRKTEPSLYRSHKRAAFLSDMEPVGNY